MIDAGLEPAGGKDVTDIYLENVKVLKTITGGEIVYEAK